VREVYIVCQAAVAGNRVPHSAPFPLPRHVLTVEIRSIEFPADSEHKRIYDALYNTAKRYFVDALESDQNGVSGKYMELLSKTEYWQRDDMNRLDDTHHSPTVLYIVTGLILRIRQSCNHLSLIPDDYRERATALKEAIIPLGEEEGMTLLKLLQGAFKTELVECAVCMDELEENDAVILRNCKHIFCAPCLGQIENHLCPLCRMSYSSDDMVKKQSAQAAASKRQKVNANEALRLHARSPKMQAVIECIDEMQPDEKGVIFSQWTSMLDIVAAEFDDLGIVYTRIDGTMNAQARVEAGI
jgi:SNF2 family DNA or RNA helicase